MATEATTVPLQSVGLVDSSEMLAKLIDVVAAEQKEFGKFTQEQVDRIFSACSLAANQARVKLAKMAVEEAGMGILEDKTIKNHFSCEYVHSAYKDMKTCGVVERDEAGGYVKYAEPVGLIAGIVPCTNPTSTTIFKALLAVKTRNCIIFSPHPRTAKCTIEAARIVRDAAVANGAPPHCVAWIDVPTVPLCNELMTHEKVSMIVATGGPGLVKAAYCSGKPAIGGGAGNTPVIIDETADVPMAVNSVLLSKTFDNGMICSSEQAVIVVQSVADQVKQEFLMRGAHFLSEEEKKVLGDFLINDKGMINPSAVGQPAAKLAQLAGLVNAPDDCRLLIGELNEVGRSEKLSHEKLCPCLGFYVVPDFDAAIDRGLEMVEFGGMGHTSVLYTNLNGPLKTDRINKFQNTMPTGRTLICMPTSQGAIGNVFNFRQMPSLSLGCGSWGSNATAECLQAKHLLNYKQICERREHVLWFRVPPAIYFNRGSLTEALRELQTERLRKAFIVTNAGLKTAGHLNTLMDALRACEIDCDIFPDVLPDPEVKTINAGVARMQQYNPDVVIALGGGSVMGAAKMMRLFYEHPEAQLDQLIVRFMDMQKRIVRFPKLGSKVKKLVCVPTTSGTGSEMTPFAVVLDKEKNIKYPVADYSLTPDVAIIDADLVMSMPANVAANGGFAALSNAIESYVSMLANDYTRGLSLRSMRLLFNALEKSVGGDANAREDCHNAVAIGAMACANAFVGICTSMANQLVGEFNMPIGVASAILICSVVLFNGEAAPSKQGTFAQYTHPLATQHYAEIVDSLWHVDEKMPAEKKVGELIAQIQKLTKALGMPRSVQAFGVNEEIYLSKIDDMALAAFDDQATNANPRYPLVAEIRELLFNAYYGIVRPIRRASWSKTDN